MKILSNFDRVITEVLADKVKARLSFKVRLIPIPVAWLLFGVAIWLISFGHSLKGHLDTYRFCDEVWTFLIKDATFKLDNQTTVHADKVKIVSCNSKRPGEV